MRLAAAFGIATVGFAGGVHAQGYPGAPYAVRGGEGHAVANTPPGEQGGLITSAESFELAPGETVVDHDPLPPGSQHIPHQHISHQHIPRHTAPSPLMTCDTGCDRSWYATAEALYFRRSGDESFTLSRDFRLDEFDHEWGGRLSFGYMLDCIESLEFVYTGQLEWEMNASATDPANDLDLSLTSVAPLTDADIDTFFDAAFQSQQYRAELDSFEFNHRCHGWDVISLLYGARVIDYTEDYNLFSNNTTEGTGFLRERVENLFVGGQIGADLLYPLGKHLYVGSRTRAGLFLNFAEATTQLVNDASVELDNRVEDEELAGMLEYGIFAVYHFDPTVRLRAGYDVWYLGGVGTVPEQFGSTIGFDTGTEVFVDEDVLVHGATAGVEFVY